MGAEAGEMRPFSEMLAEVPIIKSKAGFGDSVGIFINGVKIGEIGDVKIYSAREPVSLYNVRWKRYPTTPREQESETFTVCKKCCFPMEKGPGLIHPCIPMKGRVIAI